MSAEKILALAGQGVGHQAVSLLLKVSIVEVRAVTDARALELVREGVDDYTVAHRLGLKPSRVKELRRNAGIFYTSRSAPSPIKSRFRTNQSWTEDEIAQLKQMRAAGVDWHTIGQKLGRSSQAVYERYAKAFGNDDRA